jgi:hypothetical protein
MDPTNIKIKKYIFTNTYEIGVKWNYYSLNLNEPFVLVEAQHTTIWVVKCVCIVALHKTSDNLLNIATELNHFILPKTSTQIAKAAYLSAEMRMRMFVVAYLITLYTAIEWMT